MVALSRTAVILQRLDVAPRCWVSMPMSLMTLA